MIKQFLLAPGPTAVPSRVLLAMARPIIHHRTPQFSALFAEVRNKLRALFKTQQDVLILAASGTGAMEAAVSNCFSAGDAVIVVNGGKFGERWLKLCESFALKPVEIRVEWGRSVRPDQIEQALRECPSAKGVLVQASETSTTALHPIREIAAVTRARDALLIVDGITAVGVYDLPMDEWGIDVLITGSQKALMLPPGLAFIALSERAWSRVKGSDQRRYYFDLTRERTNQEKNTTAYTPAISLVIGLRESLAMLEEEGIPRVYARHERMARATRAAAEALELRPVAPESPSPAVTGVYVPDGVDGGKLVGYLRDRMGVTFAGGQDHLKGRIVRVAHLGYVGALDVIAGIAALEMALNHFGHRVPFGRGVAAAEAILMDALPD
ncbi:MAG: class V aminotransferase [Acidobacteria bacterium RBG_16_68_9]|nr:MAG: class V aminotransferase [Acidobacteria bacterium RBG_16_68_9]